MDISTPYGGLSGNWLKGALHNHSTNSDGEAHPIDAAKAFEALGFDFMVLTDHNTVPSSDQVYKDGSILVIPGCEYRGEGADSEIGIVGVTGNVPRREGVAAYVEAARQAGDFLVYNHPKWHINHWNVEVMNLLRSCDALEVYNAVCDSLPGSAECSDVWDRLLTCGYRVWGVATDDAHKARQRNRAWVMVDADRNTSSIISALKAGRFYSSSGVSVENVTLEGNRLSVESDNAQEIRFFSDRGSMRHRQMGRSATYKIQEHDIFVRVELYGEGASKAWLNPLFVETERSRELSEQFNAWSEGIPDRLNDLLRELRKSCQ